MMELVRDPSTQMEKFDRPMRSVNCYDNAAQRKENVETASYKRRSNVVTLLRHLFDAELFVHVCILDFS